MELRHYTGEPFTLQYPREYTQDDPRGGFGKPRGLWVSVKGECDWHWWCKSENFRLDMLEYEYEVKLRPSANICYLETPQEIDGFHNNYAEEKYTVDLGDRYNAINWGKVAVDWDGIIIAPYQWSRRLEGPMWYYGWDCASGCIWNIGNAIQTIGLIT